MVESLVIILIVSVPLKVVFVKVFLVEPSKILSILYPVSAL